jgi:hypothetical protein
MYHVLTDKPLQRWLNFGILIATITTKLLNFVPAGDSKGLVAAGMFTYAAMLAIFVYRARRLRARRADGLYYDKWGPTILCVVLLGVLGTNIGMRVAEMI